MERRRGSDAGRWNDSAGRREGGDGTDLRNEMERAGGIAMEGKGTMLER
jgi:hypothetical protein